MHYYSRNIGDYLKDTNGLSLIEHGAYGLLLDWAYANEKPLPLEEERLHRICCAVTKQDRQAVKAVLVQFWTLEKDGWTHKRVIKEIRKYYNKKESGAANVGKRWHQTDTNEDTNEDTKLDTNEDTKLVATEPTTITRVSRTKNQEPRTISPVVPKGTAIDAAAAALYELYPKKVGKTAALKAIVKVLKRPGAPTELELQTTVKAYRDAVAKWDEQDKTFVPHPATWFNQGRYADDPATWIRESDSSRQNAGQKKGGGAALPEREPTLPLTDVEPEGWGAVWAELYPFPPPSSWRQVPESNRRDVLDALRKKKGGAA